MLRDPAELRRKADSCRELAEWSDTDERMAHWIQQAAHWEALAVRAERKSEMESDPGAME